MKKLSCTVGILMLLLVHSGSAGAAIIWSGSSFTFTRAPNVDWTLPANQDQIASDVWLTRASTKGLFNIAQETSYANTFSPKGTEWAYGTAANWQLLTFKDWETWHGKNPPSSVGKDAVLHLISSDTYIDIKFLSWDTAGGSFSYVRSTPTPEPDGLILVAAGAVALAGRRRRPVAKMQVSRLTAPALAGRLT